MKTPEQIESEIKESKRRDRFVFYWGMFAGCLLTITMLLINRL